MSFRTVRLAVIALVTGVGFHACSSPTEPLRATTMTLSAAVVTLDAVGATSVVTASILDQKGKPLVGVVPVWASTTPAVATVSSTGLITAVGNGTAQVTATVEAITQTISVTVQQVPVSPIAFGGNAQTAKVLTALPQPLQVRVEDRLGVAIAGATVTFTVVSGGGVLSAGSAATSAGGLASVQWTIGKTAGLQQSVSASVTGNGGVALFTATGLADDPVAVIAAPNVAVAGQRVKFGTAVPVRPAVQVLDKHGNGVAGTSVSFVVIAGGGRVTGESVASGANGIATVGSWIVGTTATDNVVEARVEGFPAIRFTVAAIEDPCVLAGAMPIALGDSIAGVLSDTDCTWTPPPGAGSLNDRFDLYRFTLAARTGIVIEMQSTNFDALDPFLYLIEATRGDSIAANDDIEDGVRRDARIARTLEPGTYLIRATAWEGGDRGPYRLIMTGCAIGVPAQVRIAAGNGQVAVPGSAVAVRPQVAVLDACGAGVSGATVTFATVEGVGSVSGATAVTDGSGLAAVGGWTLAAGPNVLSATMAGAAPGAANVAVFSATGKASTAGFDIGLRFVTMPTVSQLTTFAQAAGRWEAIITGDLPTQPLSLSAGTCNSPDPLNESVDDVLIIVRLEAIDGPGAVLGSAGPCAARLAANGGLTALGTMRFDTADLAALENAGSFANVILHEMGHVLGIGTLWTSKGLLQNPSSVSNKVDTHFSGASAITAFDGLGGFIYTAGQKVPVENCLTGVPTTCGSGTINSHWREAVLRSELMTGYLNSGSNPLSALTIASLRDIGYVVDDSKADAYAVPSSLMGEAGLQSMDQGLHLQDDIDQRPVMVLDSGGRPIGTPATGPMKKRRRR